MTTIIEAVFAVFTEIGDWIAGAMTQLTPIFYNAETGLTLIGVTSLCGLGIGVVLLIINKISDFLRFR